MGERFKITAGTRFDVEVPSFANWLAGNHARLIGLTMDDAAEAFANCTAGGTPGVSSGEAIRLVRATQGGGNG